MGKDYLKGFKGYVVTDVYQKYNIILNHFLFYYIFRKLTVF